VPAYAQCTSPNRNHGPPLAHPSCNPPVRLSTALNIGSPDTNGAPANAKSSVKVTVLVGVPGGSDDSDVEITGSITDVRCEPGTATCGTANAAAGPDYTGELRIELRLRITDRGAGDIPATVVETPFPAETTCASTTSTGVGATCTLSTTADAIAPGSVPERERSIWALDQVQVYDGGPDGDVATPSGDQVFLRQGIFVP
jgi:hypothetical protein